MKVAEGSALILAERRGSAELDKVKRTFLGTVEVG